MTPLRGLSSGLVTVAVTVWVVPTGFVASVGSKTRFGASTTMPEPAIRMYASPHTEGPVSTSVPHVGLVGVSVATASADQSVGKVGNDSWTEQPQPCRLALVSVENWAAFAISDTEPPQGGVRFCVQSRRIVRQERQELVLPVTDAVGVVVGVVAGEGEIRPLAPSWTPAKSIAVSISLFPPWLWWKTRVGADQDPVADLRVPSGSRHHGVRERGRVLADDLGQRAAGRVADDDQLVVGELRRQSSSPGRVVDDGDGEAVACGLVASALLAPPDTVLPRISACMPVSARAPFSDEHQEVAMTSGIRPMASKNEPFYGYVPRSSSSIAHALPPAPISDPTTPDLRRQDQPMHLAFRSGRLAEGSRRD